MRKVVYITYEFFLYLDKIIVKELNDKYDLSWKADPENIMTW
jgi:hypothetical protein